MNKVCKGLVFTKDSIKQVMQDTPDYSLVDPNALIQSKVTDWKDKDLEGAWALDDWEEQLKACREWRNAMEFGQKYCCQGIGIGGGNGGFLDDPWILNHTAVVDQEDFKVGYMGVTTLKITAYAELIDSAPRALGVASTFAAAVIFMN